LLAVVLGLDVLVSSSACGNDNPDGLSVYVHPEPPLPRLDSRDSIGLRDFPAASIRILAANVLNAVVRAVPICLVDACDLMVRQLDAPVPMLVIPACQVQAMHVSRAATLQPYAPTLPETVTL